MIVQNNFSVSRNDFHTNMEVSVNGYIFVITEILPAETGKGKQYKGILTMPDGTKKVFMDKPVFVTKLNEYAGAKGTKVASKKEASHNTGTSKVVSVSHMSEASIEEAIHTEHKKAVKAYYKLIEALSLSIEDAIRIGLYDKFMKELNKKHTNTRNRLEAKLAEQRKNLDIAKQAKFKRIKQNRIDRLQRYIDNYDAGIGRAALNGNMLLVQKLSLTKTERILRANTLIQELLK